MQAAKDARESAIQRYAAAVKKSVPARHLALHVISTDVFRTCRFSAIKAAAAAAKSAAQKKSDDAAAALKKKKAEAGVAAASAAAAKKAADAAASAQAAAAKKERMISTVASSKSSKSNLPQVAAVAASQMQMPARGSVAPSIDTEVKYYRGHECSMAVIFPDDAEFASACARAQKERAAKRSRAASAGSFYEAKRIAAYA